MSMSALIYAVKARIVDVLGYVDGRDIDIMPDGQPRPDSGPVFVALSPGNIGNSANEYIDGRYGLTVTISLRAPTVPVDRVGHYLLFRADEGLYPRAEAIAKLIHGQPTPINLANDGEDYSIGPDANGFVEVLRWRGSSYLGWKPADWFWSKSNERRAGVAIAIRFEDARRVEAIEDES